MPPQKTSNLGKSAEDLACKLLADIGYKILDRNFHSRFGEIDIIAEFGGNLVFIEVKARWSLKFGLPEEAVTKQKIYKIIKTAQYYSLIHPELSKNLRIEVVALTMLNNQILSHKIIKVD